MDTKKEPFALVTGACSGIGYSYAKTLAGRGYNLVVVSNRKQEIDSCASFISSEYGVKVYPLCINLADSNGAMNAYQYCISNGIEIEVLVNNAGVFMFKQLIDSDFNKINLMINLHVNCVSNMCMLFGRDMCKRRKGYIINMSSLSAWMNFPGIATYEATKSYLRTFSKALWYEMKEYGVNVTTICPGAVDTDLYNLSPKYRKLGVKLGVLIPPDKLVIKSLKASQKGRREYIPGTINIFFIPLVKLIPDSLVFYLKRLIAKYESPCI